MTRKTFSAVFLVFAAGLLLGALALAAYRTWIARPGPGGAAAVTALDRTVADERHYQTPNTLPPDDAPGATPAPAGGPSPENLARIAELRANAAQALRRGDPQQAINSLALALSLSPDDDLMLREMSHANAAMGWRRYADKDFPLAVDFFGEAVHYWEGNEDAARGMAFSLYQDREPELAEQWLLYYMALGGSRPDAYALLGRIYYDQNRLELALGYFNQGLSLMPEQPEVIALVDKIHRELKVEEGFFETRTSHFVIKYEGIETPGLNPLVMMMCEEAYLKVGGRIGHYPEGPVTVLLYTREQFTDVTHSPAWAGAIFDGKIRVPAKGLSDRDEVAGRIIYHEYTHAAVHDLSQGRAPVWLHEGLAQMSEGAPYNVSALAMDVLDHGGPLPLSSLERGFLDLPPQQAHLAYAESYLAAAYLTDAFGPYAVRELLRRLKEGSDIGAALEGVTYQGPDVFFGHFKAWVEEKAGTGPG